MGNAAKSLAGINHVGRDFFRPIHWIEIYVLFVLLDIITHQSIHLFTFYGYVFSCVAAFINIEWLVPSLFGKRPLWLFILSLIALIVVSSLLKISYGVFVSGKPGWPDTPGRLFFPTILVVGTTMAVHFSLEWSKAKERVAQSERERLSNELNYLKTQLNPHFFFNSINCVYHLIDIDKEEAKDAMLRMAELLRFQLYECQKESISIHEEFAFLGNYVAFESLKKQDETVIHFSHSAEEGEGSIAPLLLIPFVENAFKHVSRHPERNDNVIRITISEKSKSIHLECINTTDSYENREMAKGGIGIKNVMKRLDLEYRGKFSLSQVQQNNCYVVNLSISL